MKLKRLIIQGFKSFKDRTTINFDDGITGIVGPNGCGKSNIVDALFWVMGEQSAKHLRGNTMKDVIFSGSSRYTPGSFAEATLVLENSEGKHIHIGQKVASPSEIQLTRKLYRNGETEYRINGEPARLKDIQEVFMDTGAGAKSYSIIAQGEINRLVQAKPEERRTMIEEVAGVTKFKLRKRESLRKIEQTELNLGRLQDLKLEIEKNLKTLQKQAEKAQRARSLKEKIQRNELVVQSHKVFEHLKVYRDGLHFINEKNIELESKRTQKEQLEISLQEERHQKDIKTEAIEELQKEYNLLSKELAAKEERLNNLCQNLTHKEKDIEVRHRELSELAIEMEERDQRLRQLKEQMEALESEEHQAEDFANLSDQVEILKEELDQKKDNFHELAEKYDRKQKELAALEQQIFRNTSKLEDYSASLEDMAKEIEVLEKQYSGVSGELSGQREEVKALEEKQTQLLNQERELQAQVEKQSQDYKTFAQQLTEKSRELIQKESRLNSLKEINEMMEGAKEGAQEFLKEAGKDGFDFFGKKIKCEERYARAVQSLIAPYADSLVELQESGLEGLLSWSQDHDKAYDFLSLSKVERSSDELIERLRLKGLGEVYCAGDIVKIADDVSSHYSALFSGFFIVENLTTEHLKRLDDLSSMSFRAIVSLDGKCVVRNERGLLSFSKVGEIEADGVIARNNTIEELTGSLGLLNQQVDQLEEQLASAETTLDEIKQEFEQIRGQRVEVNAELAAKKSSLESRVQNLESGSERLEILKNRHKEISKSRLELLESEEGLAEKKEQLVELISVLEGERESAKIELEDFQDQYEVQKDELAQKTLEAKSYQQRLLNAQSQIEDVEKQIERLESKKDNLSQMIDGLQEEMKQAEVEISTLEEENQQQAQELLSKEEVLSQHKDVLAQLLIAMQEREDQVKELSAQINKIEKELVETESRRQRALEEECSLTRDVFEKYRIDLRLALGRFLEFEESDYHDLEDIDAMYIMETESGPIRLEAESFEFHRRYGQDLKECEDKFRNYKREFHSLGEINWQAIEDFERQKLRYDFLQTQELELRQSLDDLKKAIEHIDQKSKERFKMAFEEVNTRFEKVFPIIFGGGSAELKVVGDIDSPDCGVDIVAQPPGKKMQNINLMSGGEKALTAVSLIFSIFLVKPSPFCLLDEVDAPLDDANVGRFNELLREMSSESQFILITHNKKTMELNDTLYGVTMQEAGVSKAVSVQLH